MQCRFCKNRKYINNTSSYCWCDKVNDDPDPEIERDCDYYDEATIADEIRNMSDEGLAHLIMTVGTYPIGNYESSLTWVRRKVKHFEVSEEREEE